MRAGRPAGAGAPRSGGATVVRQDLVEHGLDRPHVLADPEDGLHAGAARLPIACRRAGSPIRSTMAAASASGSRGGTRRPVSPSTTMTSGPPSRGAMSGRRIAMASMQHPAERLAVRRVQHDVHRVDARGDVAARAGEDDMTGEVRLGDAGAQLIGVRRAATGVRRRP